MQEKFQDRGSGESESKFIKVWDSETKGGSLETRQGGKPRTSCHCLFFPWVPVSRGPLELRLEEAKYRPEERGGGDEVLACSEKSMNWHPLS